MTTANDELGPLREARGRTMSRAEAAKALGWSKPRVRFEVESGRLPSVRIGKVSRVLRTVIDRRTRPGSPTHPTYDDAA